MLYGERAKMPQFSAFRAESIKMETFIVIARLLVSSIRGIERSFFGARYHIGWEGFGGERDSSGCLLGDNERFD